jgi:hypothetical protein
MQTGQWTMYSGLCARQNWHRHGVGRIAQNLRDGRVFVQRRAAGDADVPSTRVMLTEFDLDSSVLGE